MNPENSSHSQVAPHPLLVPFSIIAAGALIGAGIYFSNTTPPKNSQVAAGSNTIEEINISPVDEKDHILGNPNAPVIIVEFSDTECPFCKTFHRTLNRIMDEYGKDGKVAWVYRHFPLKGLHSKAPKEAEATECANELGGNAKFWEYLDEIFERTPSNDGLDLATLPLIASDIGLDADEFTKCLDSGKYASEVQKDYQDAVRSGGLGTPHSIIVTSNGQKVSVKGTQPYEVLKVLIDAALEESN